MEVHNSHPVNFCFNTGFVINVIDTATVFRFKDVLLEFALSFKELHVFGVVYNVEE